MRRAVRFVSVLAAVAVTTAACGDDGSILAGPTTGGTAPPASAVPETTATTVGPPDTAATTTSGTTVPPPETTMTTTTTSPPTTTTTTTAPPVVPIVTTVDASESYDDPPLELMVTIPVVSGIPDTAADSVNTLVSGELLAVAHSFRDSVLEGEPPPDDAGYPSELILGFETTAATALILSLRFNLYTYVQGAAHGSSGISTMNFDPMTGERLSLSDLLVPGTFGVTASIVEQHIVDDLWGGDATEAAAWTPELDENVLDGWAVTADGLAFSFDQYEIAFGAMGAPTVVVAWPDLAAVIDPDGPAGEYLP